MELTWELPILIYHRVAPTGVQALREWRVTPDELERQLDHLRARGYSTTTFEEWAQAVVRDEPLPGRRVLITFDDGYEDFADVAHPLLRQYELGVTLFVVSELVGGINEWDSVYGDIVPLLDWDAIRALEAEGVTIGGHTASHPRLTRLSRDAVVREISACRARLARELGHPVRAFAYPFGYLNDEVARAVGTCGFEFAVTIEPAKATVVDPMLELPRLTVDGREPFETFARMLA